MLKILIVLFPAVAVYLFSKSLILSTITLFIIWAFCRIFNSTLKDILIELDEQADLQIQNILEKAKKMSDSELAQAIIDETDEQVKAVLEKEFFSRITKEIKLYD